MLFQLQVCLKEELTKNRIQSASKVLREFHRLTKNTEVVSFKPAYQIFKEFFWDSEECPNSSEKEAQLETDFFLIAQQTKHLSSSSLEKTKFRGGSYQCV